jgi:hypothetical protein
MRLLDSSAARLRRAFHDAHILTLPQLKTQVGTSAAMTVFRKLKPLGYLTSYSHRGRYYTLAELAAFDEGGLWSVNDVWFSREGTLVRTCETWVNRADGGYYADELRAALHVEVKDALRQLVQEKRLARRELSGRYLYVARAPARRQQQVAQRQGQGELPGAPLVRSGMSNTDEVKAAIVLFYSMLNERQRRVYAGLESLKLGHGGDRRLAEWLDLDPHTVAKGRRELLGAASLSPTEDTEYRVRRPGGGRTALEKKRHRSSPSSNG